MKGAAISRNLGGDLGKSRLASRQFSGRMKPDTATAQAEEKLSANYSDLVELGGVRRSWAEPIRVWSGGKRWKNLEKGGKRRRSRPHLWRGGKKITLIYLDLV